MVEPKVPIPRYICLRDNLYVLDLLRVPIQFLTCFLGTTAFPFAIIAPNIIFIFAFLVLFARFWIKFLVWTKANAEDSVCYFLEGNFLHELAKQFGHQMSMSFLDYTIDFLYL